MALIIRPMEFDDVTTAVQLIRSNSLAPEPEDPDDLHAYWAAVQETRDRLGDVLVAERDGAVVGGLQVIIFRHFQHAGGWCCELAGVFVRGDVRDMGVGSALLSAAEDLARSRGCYRIQTTSRNYRSEAHRFYQSHGFELIDHWLKKTLDD